MQNLSCKDFFKKTTYNEETLNQIWMSQIADSHDNICCCTGPFAHLLASIFPPGHQDRNLTINQILQRDYREQCLSGGAAAGSSGGVKATEDPPIKEDIKEENYIEDADLTELLAAAGVDADTEKEKR